MILDAISQFTFKCPSFMIDFKSIAKELNYDSDDDLDIDRDREGILLIGIKLIIVYYYIYMHSKLFSQSIVRLQNSI